MKHARGATLYTDKHCYTLIHAIGNGGTSFVWRVEDEKGTFWAAKILDPESWKSKTKRNRFKQEIVFQSSARNKNIVKILDHDSKYSFCVMKEYPKTFRTIMGDRSIDPRQLLRYFQNVCQAISYAHHQGIIHRDIKPENIFYDKEKDQLLLGDFGIAHFQASELTQSGERLANEKYRAPEQTKHSSEKIGFYTDVFAMGLILNELFTGKVPAGENYPKIADCYPSFAELDDLVARMIKSKPEEREGDIDRVSLRLAYLLSKINRETIAIRKALAGHPGNRQNGLIRKQAVLDLFFAKDVIQKGLDLSKYDLNYHCNIHYQLKPEARDSCLLVELHNQLVKKFRYESAAVKLDVSIPGDPQKENGDNEDDDLSFFHRLDALQCYHFFDSIKKICLKMFFCLRDYHRKEILADFEKYVSRFDNDFPVLCLCERYLALTEWGFDGAELEDVCEIIYQKSHSEVEEEFSNKTSWEKQRLDGITKHIETLFPGLEIVEEGNDAFALMFSKNRQSSFLINDCLAFQKRISQQDVLFFDIEDVCQKIRLKTPLNSYDLEFVILPSINFCVNHAFVPRAIS